MDRGSRLEPNQIERFKTGLTAEARRYLVIQAVQRLLVGKVAAN